MLDPRIAAGERDEDLVRAALEARGWQLTPFGLRMFNPEQCPEYGRRAVWDAVRLSDDPMRHAPDFLAGRPTVEGARLVEVVRCDPGRHRDRCLEIAKLTANDRWAQTVPTGGVWYIDLGDLLTWRHTPGWESGIVEGPTRYTNNGTGDPYAWFRRAGSPFDDVWGARP